MSEVRTYLGIILFSIVTITINIRHLYPSLFRAFHDAAFQVGSIITTTGFATADFDSWPQYSRCLLVIIMFIGACAGSTGGGIKVSRIVILFKTMVQEIRQFLHPRGVSNIKMDGKTVDKRTVRGVLVYLAVYIMVFTVSVLIVCMLESHLDLESVFTSVACTFNNIGPGLSAVGPTKNFFFMSVPTKYVLMFDMLAGRLELYPMMMLFAPSAWRKI